MVPGVEERRLDSIMVREVPSYCDPELAPGSRGLVEVALALWRRKLVRPVRRRGPVGFQMFAVGKSDGQQRLLLTGYCYHNLTRSSHQHPALEYSSPRSRPRH